MLNQFTVVRNDFLNQDVNGFYRTDYIGYKQPNNPNYLNYFKNTFNNFSYNKLNSALSELKNNMINELNFIYQSLNLGNEKLYICVVPRAKALDNYSDNQLVFRNYFKSLLGLLQQPQSRIVSRINLHQINFGNERLNPNLFGNGIDFIIRTQNTKTTHLARSSIENDGDMPYIGITKKTCQLSPDIRDKHILLIDDIYTKNVNIDEDALQALLDCGAKSITLFAIAKTRNYEINLGF